jgi:hypothetical protein
MRGVADKTWRENLNIHFTFYDYFFFFENRAVYEIMWKNMVQPYRPQMANREQRRRDLHAG